MAVQRLLERTNHREQVWESIKDDQLISGIYNSITMTLSGRLASWRAFVESALTQGVVTLLDGDTNELRIGIHMVERKALASMLEIRHG